MIIFKILITKLFILLYTLLFHTEVRAQTESITNEAAANVVQDSMACYTVSVAAKILSNKAGKWNKNILFSPASLYHANAVALLGASGSPKKKLKSVLGINNPKYNVHVRRRRQIKPGPSLNDIYATVGELMNITANSDKTLAAKSNVGVFVHNDFAIKSTFIEDAREYLNTEVMCTDFKNQNEASTDLINRYIARKTNNRIPNFYEEPLPTSTQLVIISSSSLNTEWLTKPSTNNNARSIFSGRDDSCENSEISLLTGVQNISYTKLENLQIETIAIPFKDPNLALYIVLPSKGIMVTSIVSNPNKNLLLEIIQSMKPENVQYAIPKMKYSDNINQLELLKQDGLSNITEDDIADHLVLSNIQQKTEIDLNEDGIGIPKTENMDNNAPPTEVADASVIQFIVDRPYIFFIYNKLTKLFLYYGMVLKPEGYDE